jgi:hypothetical protein
MNATLRAGAIAVIALGVGLGPAWAQFTVTDPATTGRNAVTAALKAQIYDALAQEYQRLQRMAQRLSTGLSPYVQMPPDTSDAAPADEGFYVPDYWRALRNGHPTGSAYAQIARERQDWDSEREPVSATTEDALTPDLAMLDIADQANINGTDVVGTLQRSAADDRITIDRLERDVVDSSSAQSATAVLDKVTAGLLIGARQRQERLQYLTLMAEQLLVDGKRAREAEAAMLNMQAATARAHDMHADALFSASDTDDLRGWRQP